MKCLSQLSTCWSEAARSGAEWAAEYFAMAYQIVNEKFWQKDRGYPAGYIFFADRRMTLQPHVWILRHVGENHGVIGDFALDGVAVAGCGIAEEVLIASERDSDFEFGRVYKIGSGSGKQSILAVAEAATWRGSLERKPPGARRFYGVLAIAMTLGLALDYTGPNAVKLLFWSAIVNGVLAPPLILLIVLLTSNRKVMGDSGQSTAVASSRLDYLRTHEHRRHRDVHYMM